MRILLLAPHPFFQHRGTPLAERTLLETLSGNGHEVDVLTYHEGEDVEIRGCRILRIPSLPGVRGIRPGFSVKKLVCDAVMLGSCLRLVARRRYDLVHAVEESVFMAMAVRTLFGVPFVYDMDSSLSQQMIDRFPALRRVEGMLQLPERIAVRRSIGILAVCRLLEDRALAHDPGGYSAVVEDTSLLTEEELPGEDGATTFEDGPVAMYVGNLEAYQGIDLLVDGFRRAVARVPNARLVVIGGREEDLTRYRSQVREQGMERNIRFAGPRSSHLLGAYLRRADILVSPRVQGENTPMKIYSYLDAGRPLLATRLPTHTQVLDDDIAVLVEPEPEAFAEGLVRLLEDAQLRESLAERARERFQVRYSPSVQRTRLLEFYGGVERRLAATAP